jgi:hypothetical protein
MEEFAQWLAGLDPAFAFLLALPFAIGALGLLGEAVRRQARDEARTGRPRALGRRGHGSHLPTTGS